MLVVNEYAVNLGALSEGYETTGSRLDTAEYRCRYCDGHESLAEKVCYWGLKI